MLQLQFVRAVCTPKQHVLLSVLRVCRVPVRSYVTNAARNLSITVQELVPDEFRIALES